jgi:hypothetical protein
MINRSQIKLLTFASEGFYPQQNLLIRSAPRGGITESVAWTEVALRATAFYSENRAILDAKRGSGYWLWKPYLIRSELEHLKSGDFLVYYDVGRPSMPHKFSRPIFPILNWCAQQNGGMLPGTYVPQYGRNAKWTKRECFVVMDCDSPRYWEHPQIQATYSVWQKSDSSLAFVEDWLHWCLKPAALTDERSLPEVSNFDDFVDHRHDQSILTNLAIKNGIKCFGNPHVALAGSKNINNLVDRVQGKNLSIVVRNVLSFGTRQFNQRILGK